MTLTTVDSSVLIPALQSSHEAHEQAARVLRRANVRITGHVLIETYSNLTGGRLRPRVNTELAATALGRFGAPLALSPDGYVSTIRRCAEKGIMGGAVYDALIAATAQQADARLVSRDHRAARTYEAIGVGYELVV